MIHTKKSARPNHHISTPFDQPGIIIRSVLRTKGQLFPSVHRQISPPRGSAIAGWVEPLLRLVIVCEDTQRLFLVYVRRPDAK